MLKYGVISNLILNRGFTGLEGIERIPNRQLKQTAMNQIEMIFFIAVRFSERFRLILAILKKFRDSVTI